MSDLTFVLSDTLAEEASEAFALHRDRVLERLPDASVRHIGGTSVAGLLTTGDVDIVVRVEEPEFEHAKEVMSELYEPLHPDRWDSDGAFFEARGTRPHVEFAVTVMGTVIDLHHGDAWLRIAADRDLAERYNALKRRHAGRPVDEYLAAKRAFFDDNFRLD